jgi:RNA polymerase sigma factor (sigma-70 family)
VTSPEDTLSSLSDDTLAARCAVRPVDEAAWREFWRRFYPWLYRKVARLLNPAGYAKSEADIDDVLQWVFVKVFHAIDAFDPQKSPLRAYLSVIATTTVADQLRRNVPKRTVSLAGTDFVAENLESGRLEAEDLWRMVVQILEEMGPTNADLVRGFLEGESPKRLAEQYHVTASHVHSVVYRFRRRLRRDLQAESGRPSELPSSLRK